MLLSVCLFAAGAGLWIMSLITISRANPGDRLSLWRSPRNTPGRSILFRALGAGLLIAGFVYLGTDLGPLWVAPLMAIIILATPAVMITRQHNRRVTAS